MTYKQCSGMDFSRKVQYLGDQRGAFDSTSILIGSRNGLFCYTKLLFFSTFCCAIWHFPYFHGQAIPLVRDCVCASLAAVNKSCSDEAALHTSCVGYVEYTLRKGINHVEK